MSDARLPSFVTSVLESSLRVLSLPASVSVLFERSNDWTRPWSALEWPLAESLDFDAVALLP